jgi:hypothetical protein
VIFCKLRPAGVSRPMIPASLSKHGRCCRARKPDGPQSPSRSRHKSDTHHSPQLPPSLLSPIGSAPIDASSPLYWRSRRNYPLDVHQYRPRRGAGPAQATRSAGRVGRSPRTAELKRELKRTTNLAESVAHKAHRLWDRVGYPACGLMDNASQTLLLGVGLNRPSPEATLFSATKKVQGRAPL